MSRQVVYIAATISTIICFGLFFGFFFGLLYPEIRENTVFLTSTCNVTSSALNPSTCCSKSCSLGCFNCNPVSPTCSSLLALFSPGDCCDGSYCCQTSCSTCQSCTQHCTSSSCTTNCYPYQCNCRCSSSAQNRACTVTCQTCYNPSVTYTYFDQQGQTQTFVQTQACGADINCANSFVNASPLNSSRTCYYDPQNFQSVVFSKSYTAGPIVAVVFPSLYFGALIILGLCWGARFLWKVMQTRFQQKEVHFPSNPDEELQGTYSTEPPNSKDVDEFVQESITPSAPPSEHISVAIPPAIQQPMFAGPLGSPYIETPSYFGQPPSF